MTDLVASNIVCPLFANTYDAMIVVYEVMSGLTDLDGVQSH